MLINEPLETLKKILIPKVPTIESNRLELETEKESGEREEVLNFGSCQYEDIAIEVSKYYKNILKIEEFKNVKKYLCENLKLDNLNIKIRVREKAWKKIVKEFQVIILESNDIEYSATTLINKYNAGKLDTNKLDICYSPEEFINILQPKEFKDIPKVFIEEGWDLWAFIDGFLAIVFGIEVEARELTEEEISKYEEDEDWDEVMEVENRQYATILLYTIWLFKIEDPSITFDGFST